ncbi:hypothetical protein [Rhodoplanes roseus]|uniref:Uncharacterized protein n=1 Tax=Rhodoplanes roseus TaxID=29409 RepID=A0A327KYH1_9BRAD|nr:hypothetical protein [Rhodoplanes roseus]RAI42803.1 hypothetical protein CH341_17570 [Rhodoplanes roseus]
MATTETNLTETGSSRTESTETNLTGMFAKMDGEQLLAVYEQAQANGDTEIVAALDAWMERD